jgi:hypothetical protein
MPVFALWSTPRALDGLFRSMVERGDLLALHEPFEGLMYFGDTEVEGRTFEAPDRGVHVGCALHLGARPSRPAQLRLGFRVGDGVGDPLRAACRLGCAGERARPPK